VTRYVVVTGTDTGVGKTFVTEALARRLSRTQRVVAIKPFESGVTDAPGDGERLAAATGQRTPKHALVRLKAPLTPALAAEREGATIDFDAVLDAIREHGRDADVVLVEGAGGVLSPLTWERDLTDVVRELGAAMVLVASDRLGTISLTHTAVQSATDGRRRVAAIVLNAPEVRDASTGTNASALRRRLSSHVDLASHIYELPRGSADAEQTLAPLVDWLVR
jgi:dethiobiotin synthetase